MLEVKEVKNVKFNELERKVYNLVCELGCTIIKMILENEDEKIMKNRNKKEYRNKGLRKDTIKTVMGEIEYKRRIYLKNKKVIYLLDEKINIQKYGKISSNLAEQMLRTVVNTVSYRKGANEIKNLTNATISHQALRQLVLKVGKKIENKEDTEIKLMKEGKLIKGQKELPALFEEADGIWINLQGKDRKEAQEKYKKQCEKKNQEYNPERKMKTELKLHITYEGWKKNNSRYELVNKSIISGMMSSKRLENLRNAKVYQKYVEENIQLRASNGDGARWINNIATKDTICQKDNFHIQQEIIRDVRGKEHQEELMKIIKEKRYNEVESYIENLMYESGGEEKEIKKLKALQSYLKIGLPRYQDILKEQGREMPEAPKDIEYRNMGTMESQIFTVLKVRLCSGRKAFSKLGANYLSKICSIYYEENGDIEVERIEDEIQVDNSVEEWIQEIEENVKKNKIMHRADRKELSSDNCVHGKIINMNKNLQIKELLKLLEPTSLMYR